MRGKTVFQSADQTEDISDDNCAEFYENIRSSVSKSNVFGHADSEDDSLLDYKDGILATSSEDDDNSDAEQNLDIEKLLEDDSDAGSGKDDENQVDWGDRRENFYHKTRGEWDARDKDDMELEETEAVTQQKNLLSMLDNDFTAIVKKKKIVKESQDQKTVTELPELSPILDDLKAKCKLLKTKLEPFLAIPESRVSNVLRNAVQRLYTFYSFYCSVASLLLAMRCKEAAGYHPVVRLMLNLRKTSQQMEDKLELVLELMSNPNVCIATHKSNDIADDSAAGNESEMNDGTEEQKREVGYEILKNKPQHNPTRRQKKTKTPRTSLKKKFAKALIRRKSQVPNERNKDKPYSGEPTGIKANIKRSIKLK